MARVTNDGVTKVHIVDTIATLTAPTVAELAAGTEVTSFLTPTGLATPEEATDADISSIASVRDLSIPARVAGDLTGEFYRDDGTGGTSDDAYDALPRLKVTNIVISRFGGTGTDNAIIATDVVEVWPVRVSQRSKNPIVTGEAQRFVSKFAQSADQEETATVAA